MAKNTIPVFIVGSGRSGTRSIFKLLSGHPQIEVYHEYLCTHIQPVAAKYYMNLISKEDVKKAFLKLHGSSIYYSRANFWVDCSNKLSWIIEPIYELFPNSLFIHIVRDGRKVTSSFFHKLSPEIYDDISVKVLQNWLQNPKEFPEPPPKKKYWWNIPQQGQPFAKEFPQFNQYQRICYHWGEVIRVISESFQKIPKGRHYTVKLEDLTSDKNVLRNFLSYFEIEYADHYYKALQQPEGVFFPMNFQLNENQLRQFKQIAWKTMRRFGYDKTEEYIVKY